MKNELMNKKAEIKKNTIIELARLGVSNYTIAKILKINLHELEDQYRDDIEISKADANNKVAEKCYEMAIKGDKDMIKFWLKARAGWKEMDKVVEKSVNQTVLEVLQSLKNQTLDSRTKLEILSEGTDIEGEKL